MCSISNFTTLQPGRAWHYTFLPTDQPRGYIDAMQLHPRCCYHTLVLSQPSQLDYYRGQYSDTDKSNNGRNPDVPSSPGA